MVSFSHRIDLFIVPIEPYWMTYADQRVSVVAPVRLPALQEGEQRKEWPR